jgi:biotin carboxyl carrier protein
MTITDIQNLIDILKETPSVVKLAVTAADGSDVVIKRAPMAPLSASPVESDQQILGSASESLISPEPEIVPVISTLVGLFFNQSPQIQEGDRVKVGQRIGYIESMKIKNDVIALATGVIEKALVSEEEPVEYGQMLFQIAPERQIIEE